MSFCDGCNLECTVATTGRCAKTDALVNQITQKWDNKEQQTRLAGA